MHLLCILLFEPYLFCQLSLSINFSKLTRVLSFFSVILIQISLLHSLSFSGCGQYSVCICRLAERDRCSHSSSTVAGSWTLLTNTDKSSHRRHRLSLLWKPFISRHTEKSSIYSQQPVLKYVSLVVSWDSTGRRLLLMQFFYINLFNSNLISLSHKYELIPVKS